MKYILYGHGGSANHGCEAIVLTTLKMIKKADTEVYTADFDSDIKYGLSDEGVFRSYLNKSDSVTSYYWGKLFSKLFRDFDTENLFSLREALKETGNVCLSVGGDNYCNLQPFKHVSRNKLFAKENKTVLWGCSVTPELLNTPAIVEDMKRYSLITARESLTYNALVSAGVTKNTHLIPDPAFTLRPEQVSLPDVFENSDTIGINVSPLIMKYENEDNLLFKNTCGLIDYILQNTYYSVALIAHVVLKNNDDLTPLFALYEKYKKSGRVFLIDKDKEYNCCQIKYVISKCRFMVAARTHASIAAYSSCVPTLVIGYSVKSRGIAKDLFGTDNNYVLSIKDVSRETDLTKAFQWIETQEGSIREQYKKIMPTYIEKAYEGITLLRKL